MSTTRIPSHLGSSALLVHGLALLAGGACAALVIAACERGGDYDLRVGAVVAGTAAVVCWLWSGLLAWRALWAGEVTGWPTAVLALWLIEADVAGWWYAMTHFRMPDTDISRLTWIQTPPTAVLFVLLLAPLAPYWRGQTRRAHAEGSTLRRGTAARRAMQVLCAAAIAYVAAPQPRFFVMGIESLIKGAPASFRPPDPAVVKKLAARKISFNFVNKPVADCLALLAAHAGVTIVLDEKADAGGLWPVTLRVTDMSTALALEWVVKLVDLEYVVHGDVVIVSRPCCTLTDQQKTIRLPVRDGETPWTLQETSELCAVGEAWELSPWFLLQINVGWVKALAPGELDVCTPYDRMLSLEAWLKSRSHLLPNNYDLPDTVAARLDTKITFEFAELPVNTSVQVPIFEGAAIASIRAATGMEVTMSPDWVGDFETRDVQLEGPPYVRTVQNVSIREVLLAMHCRAEERHQQPWAIAIGTQGVRVTLTRHDRLYGHPLQYHAKPFLLDLAPAVKAGADRAALRACLGELLDDAGIGMPRQAFKIRDYWIARADPWTVRRAVNLIEEAAQTGKVPPLPPAPWFFATFPRNSTK